jgi:hypothetical protein
MITAAAITRTTSALPSSRNSSRPRLGRLAVCACAIRSAGSDESHSMAVAGDWIAR